MSMTNEQRAKCGKLHWTPAINAWRMGISIEVISKIMGYKTPNSLKTKIQQLRRKHPDWFPVRPRGFKPLVLSPRNCGVVPTENLQLNK